MRAALVVALACASLQAQAPFTAGPALDAAIEKAIAAGKTPGAGVCWWGSQGECCIEKAYGERAVWNRGASR